MALGDYAEAIRADPTDVAPYHNAVSALLGLGRVEEAKEAFSKAVAVPQESNDLVASLISENLMALFEFVSPGLFLDFLRYAYAELAQAGDESQIEQVLPSTVFALLKKHEEISAERYAGMARAMAEAFGEHMDVSVGVRFLEVGSDYLKGGDEKALLRMAREERLVFCDELGIVWEED